MAFPSPVELPDTLGFSSRTFDIGRYQQVSPGGTLFPQTIDRSEPAWFADLTTPPMRLPRYNEVRAFLDELEGSTGSALWWDPRRGMPSAYQTLPVTADPWTLVGTATPRVTAVNYTASTLTLDQLATGAIISLGDYISFLIGTVWYLYRITQGGVVTGTNTIIVKVKPRPNLLVGFATLPVAVRYRRAPFEGKIVGAIKEDDSVESFPRVTFKVMQFANRVLP